MPVPMVVGQNATCVLELSGSLGRMRAVSRFMGTISPVDKVEQLGIGIKPVRRADAWRCHIRQIINNRL
jgi:hypothetical protein